MKLRKFIKTIPLKLYFLLTIVILYAFFSNDFGLVDIQKTAIILAAAIDKAESGFSLTTQIAVPKGSDRTTGGTSSVEIDAEGETVSDCLSLIYAKTGWVPKLVFCDLILIGEEAAKEDVMHSLNFFLRNEYMPDSCLMAVCEGKAGDMLSSQSAIDDASSLAINKLFSDAAVKSGKVMPNTLREFAISYFGVSESGYLPFVRASSQESNQSAQQTAGSGSGGAKSGSQEEEKIYSAEETAIFRGGKMVGLLPREQTFAFSLLKGNVFAGTFNVKEGDEAVTLTVLKNDGGVSLECKPVPKAKFSLDLLVRLCCRGSSGAIDGVTVDTVPEESLQSAQTIVTGYVNDLWNTCREKGCDLFQLKRSLYRSSLKKYAEWKDNFLSSTQVQIKAVVKTKK